MAASFVALLAEVFIIPYSINDLSHYGQPGQCIHSGGYVTYQAVTNVGRDLTYLAVSLVVVLIVLSTLRHKSKKYKTFAFIILLVITLLTIGYSFYQGLGQNLQQSIGCIPF